MPVIIVGLHWRHWGREHIPEGIGLRFLGPAALGRALRATLATHLELLLRQHVHRLLKFDKLNYRARDLSHAYPGSVTCTEMPCNFSIHELRLD